MVKTSNRHGTGMGKPGEPVKNRPHLGDIILQKYEGILHTGFEDLKRFELIDRLEKPVLDFIFSGNKKKIIEVHEFLSGYPYAFTIRTKKGLDLWSLPERGVRNAYVFISRFPELIKFIQTYELEIPDDLWGVIFGYPLPEVHQFTYDWDTWIENQKRKAQNSEPTDSEDYSQDELPFIGG